MIKSRNTSRQPSLDGKSVVSTASEEDNTANDRVLLYPKGSITISLDIPRSKSMFVIVKTKIRNEVLELGRTDSRETFGDELVIYEKVIDITYYSGVDDHQMAIFEIMDGDLMTTSAFGYIFATVSIPVGQLFRGHNRCRVARGVEHLGFLMLDTVLDVTVASMNIRNEDKRPMSFFQSVAPNDEQVRLLHPSYVTPLGIYSLEVLCRDICNEPEDVMTESCYVVVRACLNIERFVHPSTDLKFLPPESPKLKVIWKSQKNYQKPYEVNALEIKFSHADLTGELSFERVLARDTHRKLKLIVDVWVGGTEGDSFPPIRTGFACYSVYKLLDAAGYPKTGFDQTDPSTAIWSKPLPRTFVRVANLRLPEDTDSEGEELGFFAKMFQKKGDAAEDSTKEPVAVELGKGGLNSDHDNKKDLQAKSEEFKASNKTSLFSRHVSLTKSKKAQYELELKALEEEKEKERLKTAAPVAPRRGSVLSLTDKSEASRRDSILGVISKNSTEKQQDRDKARELDRLEALKAVVVAPPSVELVKKSKMKPQKVNPDFEREMLAATVYRDPFYERMQLALIASQRLNNDDSADEKRFRKGIAEPDEGEVIKEEPENWADKLKKTLKQKKKKKCSDSSSDSSSREDEQSRRHKRSGSRSRRSSYRSAKSNPSTHGGEKTRLTANKSGKSGNSIFSSKTSKTGITSKREREKEKEKEAAEQAGSVTVRVKCFPTNMVYRPGDLVYEDRIQDLFLQEQKNFFIQTKKSFQAAVTRQSKRNKDSLYLLETLADGRYIIPFFLVDVHAPAVQGLFYGLGLREKKVVATNSTFSGSNVLNTMTEIYRIISFFALDGEFRALAGGGVLPPNPPSIKAPKPGAHHGAGSDSGTSVKSKSKKKDKDEATEDKSGGKHYYGHPAAGLSRSIAFPLAQEYLLAHLKETIGIANAPLNRPNHHNGQSRYRHHHHHHDHRKSREYRLVNDDISFAVPASTMQSRTNWTDRTITKKYDPKGLLQKSLKKNDTSSSYWGGKSYVKEAVYSDVASLTRGFIDASSIYCPSLVPVRLGHHHHHHHSASHKSECISMNTADAAEEEQEKAAHKIKAMKKIRAVRSGVKTGVNKSGAAFWSSMPTDLLRKTAYNADVETIELLLAQASLKQTGTTLNLVIWILGVCPPPEAIEKASRLFECQAKARDETALLIILASETEVELDEENDDTLPHIASPFKDFINCYSHAVHRAVGHRGDRPASEDDNEFDGSVHVRHGKKSPATSRMMMQHWMSWHEVVAQAYILEDRTINRKKKVYHKAAAPKTRKKSNVFADLGRSLKKDIPVAKPVGESVVIKAGVEKDEYPTHLSMRHIVTDRSFVGLSHVAADRVLGVLPTHKRELAVLPTEDMDKDLNTRASFFGNFFSSRGHSRAPSSVGASRRSSVYADSVLGDSHKDDDDDIEKQKKMTISDVFYQNFKSMKETRRESHIRDESHLDTEDVHERNRLKEEIRKDNNAEKELSHRRIEGYAELMAAKERFEFERQQMQRAEVRRFLCDVFLDISAMEEEKRNERGFLSSVTDLMGYSPHTPHAVQIPHSPVYVSDQIPASKSNSGREEKEEGGGDGEGDDVDSFISKTDYKDPAAEESACIIT